MIVQLSIASIEHRLIALSGNRNVQKMSTNGNDHFLELFDELLYVHIVSLVSKSSIIIILHRHVYIYIYMSVLGEEMFTSPYVSPKPFSKIQHKTKNAHLN